MLQLLCMHRSPCVQLNLWNLKEGKRGSVSESVFVCQLSIMHCLLIQIDNIQIEFMEKHEDSFTVSPTNIVLKPNEEMVKFYVKNTSFRSSRYEIFNNDVEHFKILSPRTFNLAPGIMKNIRVQHILTQKCNSEPQAIQVVDASGFRQYVNFQCFQQEVYIKNRVDINHNINLQKIKTNEEKQLDINFRNVSNENLKLRVKYSMSKELVQKIQFKLIDEQMVVLKDASKNVRVSIKLLKEVDFQIQVILEFTQETTRDRWEEVVKIRGNSLIRSQFIADCNSTRIDTVNHELLNGTNASGSIFLVNNYHKACPFKLLELIQIVDYKSYCERLEEISLKLDIKEGFIEEKGKQRINYVLSTSPSQNDKSFTYRYSQLEIKDEANSYKLRNSNFYKKNLEVLVRVQFGDDNPITFKLKAHIINPALKFSRTSNMNYDVFDILNDSNIEIPFRFNSNLYFSSKVAKGKLKPGMNQIQIQWRKQANSNQKSKENIESFLKCSIKMEIPKNEIVLYEPSTLQRPKTAMLRSASMSKENLRERVSIRAPSKTGTYGVKNTREVSSVYFSAQPSKYSKGENFEEEQFKFLQVNQSQRGNVITNAHKSKNIILYFPDKGYLFVQSQYSFVFPYQKKSLRFEFSGRAFEIKSRDVQDKQPYKIMNRQLIFSFGAGQKQFEVIREVEVMNRSNDFIMMYCLSVDDDYFHSAEEDNKVLIPPKETSVFKISFYPKAEIRLKENKIIRNIEFLINNQKESILCEGDLLGGDVDVDEKKITFNNCRYSPEEITKKITLINKGLNKVNFLVQHSDYLKITPKTNIISQKSKQVITLSFVSSKLPKEHSEIIVIYIKGSHAINIPLYVTTLDPKIDISDSVINFKEGYLNETLTASISITNQNLYPCNFITNFEETQIKCQKNFTIEAGQVKKLDFQLIVREVGDKIIQLPNNFLELCGYGPLKGLKQYRLIGKKTLLQLIPDNPFSNIIFSQIQETKSFKIKNLSQELQSITLNLTPDRDQFQESAIILSCEPIATNLYPGEEKQFKLLSIRSDYEYLKNQSVFLRYSLLLSLKNNKKYRKFDFTVQVPPPQLQITPKEVYFPIVAVSTWSKSSFKITNQGYKEVLVALKKPVNIAFDFDIKIENQTNRLTKLNNQMEVSLVYKSKKPVSFAVNLDIEDNFGKKYQIKLFGTSSNSPLLNCEKAINSSSKGFSSKEIRSSNTPSLLSSATLTNLSEQVENVRFVNRWFSSIIPDYSKDNENFNIWLKIPRNFLQFLRYFNIEITCKEDCLDFIIEELKKFGFPLYTIKVNQLMQGNLDQWSMCIWLILSKELIHQQTLRWVNKICGITIQTYESAFNHQKKIFNQLLTRLFDPIFKGKVTELQKMLEYLEPSFPILFKIQNKKQFMIAINILYHKFGKAQRQKIVVSNLQHLIPLQSTTKSKVNYWILGSNSFEPIMGPNCFNPKYVAEKKMFCCWSQADDNISIKLKDDINFAVWNNTLHDPLIVYELDINKKAPHVHNICIECENKCSQEWKLLFPCEVQSQYFFQFSGGLEFKCKMPDIGIIKAGEVMEFRIIYSPTNLKEHIGMLKISNKFQEHVYNLKGKSLRSNYVEVERTIHIPQGEKHQQTFAVIEDPDACNEETIYKVTVIGDPCEQIKSTQAKSNKKEIIVQVVLECTKIYQEKQIFLQISNEEMSYCKNIRLIISVIPKPIIVQARLKGTIDKVTVEKIPITNSLPTKQNCFISLMKITKDVYDNFNRYQLERQQTDVELENHDSDFKLSHLGKLSLKPKEKININLSYLPATLVQSYCQIRIKMEGTYNIIVYNFLGAPELPFIDNPLTIIKCQTEQSASETIKIPNRLRERVVFDVQTNISFIAGPQQITLNSRQTMPYTFKLLPLHAGQFQGEIVFKNQKFCLVYPLKIVVISKKKTRKIRVQSKIRITSTIQIELSNKSDKDIPYNVICKSQYLKVEPTFFLPANSERALIMHYTPLFVGTKTAELRIYHESMQEINYNLQLISEEHRENLKYSCELGQKKKIKLPIRNPIGQAVQLFQPKLPKQLSCHLSSGEHFPLSIPAYGAVFLELLFTQYQLSDSYSYSIEVPTGQIGNFNYDLLFTNDSTKKMPETIAHYNQSEKKQVIKKQAYIDLLNYFDEALDFQVTTPKLQINPFTTLNIDGPLKFQLKAYEKRRIRCDITILDDKTTNKKLGDSSKSQVSHEDQNTDKTIIFQSKSFKWMFPIEVVKIFEAKNTLQILGSSQEVAKIRISLKVVKGIKNWTISDLPNYKQNFNLTFISSREVYLQTIFNKPYEYSGYVMFYDEDMSCAEKYNLNIKIGDKKYQKIWITANVGEKNKVEIRLKNGKGKYKVQVKNNKMKEFGVYPMQGQFKEKGDNVIFFQYSPVEYNGNKKAEVLINSDYGSFNFYLLGKFPPLK